jgi:hypothetical protein
MYLQAQLSKGWQAVQHLHPLTVPLQEYHGEPCYGGQASLLEEKSWWWPATEQTQGNGLQSRQLGHKVQYSLVEAIDLEGLETVKSGAPCYWYKIHPQ